MHLPDTSQSTKRPLAAKQWWHLDSIRLLRLVLVLALLAAGLSYFAWRFAAPTATGTSTCDTLPTRFQTGQSVSSSSIHTIQQAYNCILDKYPVQPALDDRLLLRHALAGMMAYLVQEKQDQHLAILPALMGNRSADWQAFVQMYTATISSLPSLNQASLVPTIIREMVNSLNDDHANYSPGAPQGSAKMGTALRAEVQDDTETGFGLRFGFYPTQLVYATAPLVVREVVVGSPAALAGMRAGDTIVTVNGLPPYLDQDLLQPVMQQFFGRQPIKVQLQRPGKTALITLTLTPAAYPTLPMLSGHLLAGNLLYVRLTRFETGATQQMRTLVQQAGGTSLRGLILDLRGNGGGSVVEQQQLLGLFVHDRVLATFVDGQGQSTSQKSGTGVALLHLPLVALIDHECASACDTTAVDIHDLHLGWLIGERTAGIVSGPSTNFFLDDGSVLTLPVAFMYGPDGEIVDGIGVPPDDEVQPTPTQLAAGQDPVLARALQDFS